MAARTSHNAVRALDILLVLSEVGPEGMKLAEICRRLDVAKPAAHRSLSAAIQRGFAEHTERHGYYRLGPMIEMIAKRQQRLEPQVQEIRPAMTEFARLTGFTVYLIIQAGEDAVCAELVTRSTLRVFAMGLGARVPMGVGAGSVALLGLLPEADAERILQANALRYETHPSVRHVDRNVVKAKVDNARRVGYAVNMAYFLPGEGGIGLALPAAKPNQANMAISFNAPLELMTEAWIRETVDRLKEVLSLYRGSHKFPPDSKPRVAR